MAENFQYKTSAGGTAADVPFYAWAVEGGASWVDYPQATDLDGMGAPCGAFGRPRIIMRSPWMRGDGVKFWNDLFATSTAESTPIWLKVFSPRGGSWSWWTGILHRPTFGSVTSGAATTNTTYNDVEIIVTECEAAI